MRIALVYDLRDDYRALGFSEEEVAEFDNIETIDQLDGALCTLGCEVARVGRGRVLAGRLAAGERFDLVFSIAEGVKIAQAEHRPIMLWNVDYEPLERC